MSSASGLQATLQAAVSRTIKDNRTTGLKPSALCFQWCCEYEPALQAGAMIFYDPRAALRLPLGWYE
jgi:hypothetical protein